MSLNRNLNYVRSSAKALVSVAALSCLFANAALAHPHTSSKYQKRDMNRPQTMSQSESSTVPAQSAQPALDVAGRVTEGSDQLGVYTSILRFSSGDDQSSFDLGTRGAYDVIWDFEMGTSSTLGVLGSIGYSSDTVNDNTTSAFTFGAGARYLFWTGRMFEGLFFGPRAEVRVDNFNAKGDADTNVTTFGVGGDVGYQFPLGRSGFLMLGGNAGFDITKRDIGDESDSANEFRIAGTGGIGVRF